MDGMKPKPARYQLDHLISGRLSFSPHYQFHVETISDCDIEQTVNFATRQDNILYIFLTNKPYIVNRTGSIPVLGDHDLVHIDSHIY